MPINFDRLPTEKPAGGSFSLPEPGFHAVTIESAEMKTSQSGAEYLNLKLKLDSGEVVWDIIMDSDKPALQYKLGRLITACKLPLAGELTLADFGKVITGKKIVADIKHENSTYQGKEKTDAKVNLFDNDIFYPIEELAVLKGEAPTSPSTGNY